MKVGISISIDVTKIDKERLFKGAKGTYMDLTTFIDLDQKDQYDNNGFVSQSMTKEERDTGAPNTPILGNCKVFYTDGGAQQQQRTEEYAKGGEQAKAAMEPDFDDSDVPF